MHTKSTFEITDMMISSQLTEGFVVKLSDREGWHILHFGMGPIEHDLANIKPYKGSPHTLEPVPSAASIVILARSGVPIAKVLVEKAETRNAEMLRGDRTPGTEMSDAAKRLGRLGGLKKSPSKAAAARANGAKGGRPRKQPNDH